MMSSLPANRWGPHRLDAHPQGRYWRQLSILLMLGCLAYVLSQTLTPQPWSGYQLWWDKALHFIAWSGVSLSALGIWWPPLSQTHVPAAGACSTLTVRRGFWWMMALLAVGSEVAQLWVEGRIYSHWDLLANGLGVGCAWLCSVALPQLCYQLGPR